MHGDGGPTRGTKGEGRLHTLNSHLMNYKTLGDTFNRNKTWISESEAAQSCPTLCHPMDCSLPRFSIQGIFQARILEWIAISFSRGSAWLRDQTLASRTAGRLFTIWATREGETRYLLGHLQIAKTTTGQLQSIENFDWMLSFSP